MSDDDKRKIVDSAKQAFPELQSVPDDRIQFNPPVDATTSDALQFLGRLPGRISVWVKRNRNSLAVAVYLFCKEAHDNWTFIKDVYQFVRPKIEQIPIVASQVDHWLRCYEPLNPASIETGKRLIYSPGWHSAPDEQQLVAMINKQIEPEFGVLTTTTTSTTTTTTPAPQSSNGIVQPLRQDLLFIPEGIGVVSDEVIGGAPPVVSVLFGSYNNSQSVSRETARRIHMVNDQIRRRNMSQNYRPPTG
jgi:hypothetical protein